MTCTPSKDSDQPEHRPKSDQSLLSPWIKCGSLPTYKWWMPRLIWIFAGIVDFVTLQFICFMPSQDYFSKIERGQPGVVEISHLAMWPTPTKSKLSIWQCDFSQFFLPLLFLLIIIYCSSRWFPLLQHFEWENQVGVRRNGRSLRNTSFPSESKSWVSHINLCGS